MVAPYLVKGLKVRGFNILKTPQLQYRGFRRNSPLQATCYTLIARGFISLGWRPKGVGPQVRRKTVHPHAVPMR